MKAGDLRIPVKFLRRVEGTPDSAGHRTVTWVQHAEVYAAMNDVSGREFYEAAAHQMEDTVTFTVRWDAAINQQMRVECRGTTYEILQVNHLGYRMDFIRIKARVIEAEGGV